MRDSPKNFAGRAVRLRWSTAGRILVAALLALAVFDPGLPLRESPVDVVVVLDASDSMPPAADVWPAVAERLAALPDDSRWSLVRYGAEPTRERDWSDIADARTHDASAPRTAVDTTRSNTNGALVAALASLRADRASSILLVTDGGGATEGLRERLAETRVATMPVHWLPVVPDVDDAVRLGPVAMPALAAAGVPVELAVPLEGSVPAGVDVHLSVDGVPALNRPLLPTDGPVVRLTLPAPAAGVRRLTVALATPSGEVLARTDGVLHVAGAVDALVVGDPSSPVASLLEKAGVSVTRATPADVFGHLGGAARFGVIVLDDVSATDLDASATTRLAAALTRDGTGLVTLGGPRSFGAGAYRQSSLEALLPVLAEGREPLPPAAVLFVVDTSGSMGRSTTGPTRLAMARRAVLETARSLAPTDAAGLVTFDVAPQTPLPLAQHASPSAALDAAWPAGAGGGTRVAPALARAIDLLAGSAVEQRLLVLVTDGFVEEALPAALPARLGDAGIDVIALPVGDAAPSALLERLTALGDGRLLPVTDTAALPSLMRGEVALRRAASVERPRLAVAPATDDWIPGTGDWPTVNGYMVTRPKADAQVMLTAPSGDPLLAVMPVGAGVSAALPAGLGSGWTDDWRDWDGSFAFLSELLAWLAGQPGRTGLYLDIDAAGDAPVVRVDVSDRAGQWRSDTVPDLVLRTPADRAITLDMAPAGPGRFEATLPVTRNGVYVVSARWRGEALVRGYLHRPTGERDDARRGAARFAGWRDDGLLTDADPWQFRAPREPLRAGVRPVLLIAALLLYVALLVGERRHALGRHGVGHFWPRRGMRPGQTLSRRRSGRSAAPSPAAATGGTNGKGIARKTG